MEEVSGIPAAVPPLPEYPSQVIIESIAPAEWQACLDTWIFCVEFRLRLTPESFRHFKFSQNASGLPFLQSYFRALSATTSVEGSLHGEGSQIRLHRHCFLLLRRLLLETEAPYDYGPAELFDLLASGNLAFRKSSKFSDLLRSAWKREPQQISSAIENGRDLVAKDLTLSQQLAETISSSLRRATALVTALPEAGIVFMTGSDYLEIVMQRYSDSHLTSGGDKISNNLTEHIFVCFRSLMKEPSPKVSLLLDHLYALKTSADKSLKTQPENGTLLSSLVCSTTFLRHLDVLLATTPQARGRQLILALQTYREQTYHLHPPPSGWVRRNGKGKSKIQHGDEMHMHKASNISNIQELFPDLPTPYIFRLLDHFADNVETTIAALLEPDSLPIDLQTPTKEDKEEPSTNHAQFDLAPRSTPPMLPQKKNVFDDDDFDNLRISPSKVHRGRKDKLSELPHSADQHARSKAAIMSALAAFDSDDDERDDTYDVADVGGTVDDTLDTDIRTNPRKPGQGDPNEELLYRTWKSSTELFARDSRTRLSQHRQQMKRDTGMTDEQIEGWAVMLSRDSTRENKLSQKYLAASSFGGRQKTLIPSKWAASRSGTATEEDDSDLDPNASDSPNRATGDGRRAIPPQVPGARNFGRGRGGGSTAGPADAASTQAVRKRKEQGRGRGGANHNRREGRAKKIGRSMAGPVD